MPFKPGQSGNPSGRRPKSPEQIKFETRCREWAATLAADKLIKLASHTNPTAQIAALKEILDRGFGKPEAISYVEANVTTPTGSGVDELAGEIAALVPGAEGEGGGDTGKGQVDA